MANVVTYHMYSIRENCELHIEVLMNNQDGGDGGWGEVVPFSFIIFDIIQKVVRQL